MIETLKLSESEMTKVQNESHFQIHHTEANLSEVRKRYEFSNFSLTQTFEHLVKSSESRQML